MSIKTFGGPKSALAASLLVLSSAMPFNNAALAEPAAPQTVATQQMTVKVPMFPAIGMEPQGVALLAADFSKDSLAVVIHTDKGPVLEAVKAGVRSAITEGIQVKRLILADPIPGKPDFVEIYANSGNCDACANATNEWIGYLQSGSTRAPEGIKTALKIALEALNVDVVQPALVARDAVANVANGNKKP